MKLVKKYNFKVRCSVCGKLTAPRLPRAGKHKGDGTYWFPRRHNVYGKPCEGNIEEGIIVDLIIVDKPITK